MALSPRAQSLFRAQDTAPNPTYLMPIDPKNWKVHANKVNFGTDSNPNEGKPRYNQADYIGGVKSIDSSQATANVAVARGDGGASEPDYAPRTQPAKAALLGTVPVQDVGRRPGWIAPNQPYGAPPASPANDPTITTLSPATAAAGNATPQFVMKITGTNFTPYSIVSIGGSPAPNSIYTYISPTEIRAQMSPAASVPGAITVTVTDHGITTANKTFTWT
jgi:IPT/TIG domain